MTRYFLSTDDDGPNVLFSGTKAELVHYISTRFQQGASNSRPVSFRRDTDGNGSLSRGGVSRRPASARSPLLDGDVLYRVSLADHIENGAWPVCDIDGWEDTE